MECVAVQGKGSIPSCKLMKYILVIISSYSNLYSLICRQPRLPSTKNNTPQIMVSILKHKIVDAAFTALQCFGRDFMTPETYPSKSKVLNYSYIKNTHSHPHTHTHTYIQGNALLI